MVINFINFCFKRLNTTKKRCICGKEIDSHDQKTIKAFKSHSESPLNGVSNRKQQEALSENIIMKETRSLDLSVSGEIQFQGTSDNLAKVDTSNYVINTLFD